VRAPLTIALITALTLAACATIGPPRRFANIPDASADECGIVKAAISAVLSEEPYFSKPVDAPMISYLAISPYLVADEFEENPYEDLKEQPPVNVTACIVGSVQGPKGRVMTFDYPQQLRNDQIVDAHGWVSRPIVRGDKATVLLARGQCYRTSTIELKREGGGWHVSGIRHATEPVDWIGRDPCSPWP
jgi:hypothetical protein